VVDVASLFFFFFLLAVGFASDKTHISIHNHDYSHTSPCGESTVLHPSINKPKPTQLHLLWKAEKQKWVLVMTST
jgi:hypothetical protein